MPKTIKMTLNPQSIDRAIAELQSYSKSLETKLALIVQRLADLGLTVASAGFESAIYDGVNDVAVSIEDKGATHKAVVAVGTAVIFIEYGSGCYYPDTHPQKPDGIVGRGEYGKGHGKQNTWGYYGEAGTNGVEITNHSGKKVVLTHGNPSNPIMYNSKEAMRQAIQEIVREVFSQ